MQEAYEEHAACQTMMKKTTQSFPQTQLEMLDELLDEWKNTDDLEKVDHGVPHPFPSHKNRKLLCTLTTFAKRGLIFLNWRKTKTIFDQLSTKFCSFCCFYSFEVQILIFFPKSKIHNFLDASLVPYFITISYVSRRRNIATLSGRLPRPPRLTTTTTMMFGRTLCRSKAHCYICT